MFVNIGYGNIVNSEHIVSIVSPEAAPIKRMVQQAKDDGKAIDATCGRKTKAVLVLINQSVVLSALLPETIAGRMNDKKIFCAATSQNETTWRAE